MAGGNARKRREEEEMELVGEEDHRVTERSHSLGRIEIFLFI
jgi:hypothetical protein